MAKWINQEVIGIPLFKLLKSGDDATGLGKFLSISFSIVFVQISSTFVIWETYARTLGVNFANSCKRQRTLLNT